MYNQKEVVVELTGKTERYVTKKYKITVDEEIDIENPNEKRKIYIKYQNE